MKIDKRKLLKNICIGIFIFFMIVLFLGAYFYGDKNKVRKVVSNIPLNTKVETKIEPKMDYNITGNVVNYFLNKKSNIRIYDILGREIKSETKGRGWHSETINVSGVYFLGIDNRFVKLNIVR
jgi:hypothetical protein